MGKRFNKFYPTPFFKPFVQSPGGYYSVEFSWSLHGKNREIQDLFYSEIEKIFGLTVKEEVLLTDCYILYKYSDDIKKLQPPKRRDFVGYSSGTFQNYSMQDLASILEDVLGFPVTDETAVKGRYDFKFNLNPKSYDQLVKNFRKIGLSLKVGEREINCVTIRPR